MNKQNTCCNHEPNCNLEMGAPCSGVTMHGCGNPAYNVYCWDHAHCPCHKPQPVAVSYLAQYVTRDEGDQRYASSQDLFNLSSYIAYTYQTKEDANALGEKLDTEIADREEADAALQSRLEGYIDGKVEGVEEYVQSSLVESVEYDSANKRILFKNANNVAIEEIDATPFVKDGMVDNVSIANDMLNIVFNTDAGKQAIDIPLSSIFNPANYYTKDECNTLFVSVEGANIGTGGGITGGGTSGGGITVDPNITVDSTLNRLSSNPVRNSAITAAINDLQQWTGRTNQSYTKDLSERIADAENGIAQLSNTVQNINVPQIAVDATLSSTSENPVQNKVVYNNINDINSTLNNAGGVIPRIQSLENAVSADDADSLQGRIGALENTVDGIVTTGGEPNVITGIEVNGVSVTPVNKVVSISVPTDTVTQAYLDARFNDVLGVNAAGVNALAQLTEDNDAATGLLNEIGKKANTADVYTKAQVDNMVEAANNFNPNSYYTKSDIDNKGYLTTHQSLTGYAKTADLATVATSGSYNDLSNKPSIPAAQVQSDWNATSGMGVILNKPTIPTFWTGTQAQYDAIANKDANTFYCIYE